MNLEEQAGYLQGLKDAANLSQEDPKERLLRELCDTVSLLSHQVSLLGEVTEGMNETLSVVEEQLDYLCGVEDEEPEDGMGVDEYFDGTERTMYQVKCPSCGEKFAVDESSLLKGFHCPTCGEHLVKAE
jgi:DNA-directed RNA polymerase subunit RPC12/RpoP